MIKFRIGDKVRLTDWGVKYSLTNPAFMVRNGELENKFTIYKICPMSGDGVKMFGSEGIWISFKECCKKKYCKAHPSQHFELLSVEERVIFT